MTQPNKNQTPDFFTTKGPIRTKVTPLKFGNKIFYHNSLISENDELTIDSKPYQLKPYLDNDEEMLDCADMEENYDITLTKSGKFQTAFYVPSSLLSYIIGAKGSKLKALQRNTNTTVKIPRINEKGDVIILGDTERKVASARTQIALIVSQRKEKMKPTHFISIPIHSDEIKNNLLKFQDNILNGDFQGITLSLFQKTVKIHLTLVVMTLLDEGEIVMAQKLLEECYNEFISKLFEKGKRHIITVQGLEIMNDDPSNVYVLYAKVHMKEPELDEKLQQMCDKILNKFCKSGFAKREYGRVKLHMTVMNSSFRESSAEKGPFDAKDILEKYGDFYFGTFELNTIDLCIRGTTTSETGEPKYYDTAISISM